MGENDSHFNLMRNRSRSLSVPQIDLSNSKSNLASNHIQNQHLQNEHNEDIPRHYTQNEHSRNQYDDDNKMNKYEHHNQSKRSSKGHRIPENREYVIQKKRNGEVP